METINLNDPASTIIIPRRLLEQLCFHRGIPSRPMINELITATLSNYSPAKPVTTSDTRTFQTFQRIHFSRKPSRPRRSIVNIITGTLADVRRARRGAARRLGTRGGINPLCLTDAYITGAIFRRCSPVRLHFFTPSGLTSADTNIYLRII